MYWSKYILCTEIQRLGLLGECWMGWDGERHGFRLFWLWEGEKISLSADTDYPIWHIYFSLSISTTMERKYWKVSWWNWDIKTYKDILISKLEY